MIISNKFPFGILLLAALSFSNYSMAQTDQDADAIDLNIFPNPNRGEFYITVVNEDNYRSQLYAMDGQLVKNIYLRSGLNYISMDEPAGIYFLKVGEGEESERFKIVVK